MRQFITSLFTSRLLRMVFSTLAFMLLASTITFAQTNTGKDFWLAETPNLGDRNNFAISVANPGTTPAIITITNPIRTTVNATIAPGTLQTFQFQTVSSQIQSTGTFVNNVFHVTSNGDVVVYSFTPLVNAFTNDASLILPTNSLGTKYRPGSYVNPLGNTNGSFFGIVATQNATNIKTYNQAGTLVDNVTINEGQYFQRNNGALVSQDITGWYIETDKPAAVFSGNVCTSLGNSTAACDHIDEQILPIEAMASAYVASPTRTRPIGCTSSCSPDVFRYVATEDNTVITTTPNVGGGTINKGQFIEITTSTPHIVNGTKPFYGYQYLISQNAGEPQAGTGDPSLLGMTPVDQFQFSYLFLTPNTYAFDFINVVAPVGTTFNLDGSPVTATCVPVGALNSTTYCTFGIRVGDGVHSISANKKFGLSISGFDQFASYAYVGGLGLQPVNAGCNTGGPYRIEACTITPIQLNGIATCSNNNPPTAVQWSSSEGVIFSNAAIPNPTATVPGYGTFNITLKVTCGNTSVSCSSTITLLEPAGGCNAPPVAKCKPVVVTANGNCQGSANAADFNDNSTDPNGDVLSFSVAPAGPYPVGVTNVTLTVTDSKGASNTCQTTITVVDPTPPSARCKNVSVQLNANGTGSVTAAAINDGSSDNCGIASMTLTGKTTYSCADVGQLIPVTLTITDLSGNTSGCVAQVSVIDPNRVCNNRVTTWYRDADGDGYGNRNISVRSATQPPGYVSNRLDCNDNDPTVHSPFTYFRDADGDGFGNVNGRIMVCSSTPPQGYVRNFGDCDDTDPTARTKFIFYQDADGDGVGNTNNSIYICHSPTPPAGYVRSKGDCDDNNPAIKYPRTYFRDADGDGFGDKNGRTLICSLTPPPGYVSNFSDPNDNDPNVPVAHQAITTQAPAKAPLGVQQERAVYFTLSALPNPVKATTRIMYSVPVDARVRISVFDALGRAVGVVFDGARFAGTYSQEYSTHKLSQGLYYCRMEATANGQQFVQTRKLVKVE